MDQTTLTLIEAAATNNNVYDASLSSIKQTATGADFSKVAYASSLGLWVSVGANGYVAVSKDNVTWEFFSIVFNVQLNSVAFANNLFVAVGNSSTVFTSINGYDWTQRTFPVTGVALTEVVYGNNLWITSSNTAGSGRSFSSTDGITWQPIWTTTGIFGNTAYRYATPIYANGTWVSILGNQPATSTDGITWTARIIDTSVQFVNLYYTGSLWLATNSIGNATLAVSADAINWTIVNRQLIPSGNIRAFANNGNTVVISGTNGWLWVSNDGGYNGTIISAIPSTSAVNGLTYGNNRFVAITSISNEVYVSTNNGATWTQTVANLTQTSSAPLIYANGLFVIANGPIRTSPDGTTWTLQTSQTTQNLFDMKYLDNKFVGVGAAGTIRTSVTGTGTWTIPTATGTANVLQRVSFGNGLWVAVGASGTIVTATNPAGTWTLRTSGVSTDLFHVDYNNSLWVAYGSFGVILTSTNGTAWTVQKRDLQQPRSYAYGNGLWTGVGNSGEIVTSPDFSNWTFRTSGTANILNNVIYKNNEWMVVGNSGTVLQSTDATTWNVRTNAASQTTQNLQHIDFGNGVWAACGSGSGMITSSDTTTWQARTLPKTSNLSGIVYSGSSNWTTSGSWGLIQTSSNNATNWTQRTSFVGTTPLPALNSVDYGSTLANPLFVAVGGSGCILSSPDGINWTTRTSSTLSTLNKVLFANNTFVVVGAGGTIRTSTDGITWATPIASGVFLFDVAYGSHNNTWVIVGSSNVIRTASGSNLASWSSATSGFTGSITMNCVKYANGMFVLGASGTQQNLRYSSTGTGTWTAVANSTSLLTGSSGHATGINVLDIDYIDGKFFNLGYWPCSSTDGINWTYLGYAGPNQSQTSVDYMAFNCSFMKNVNNKLIATAAVSSNVPIFISKNGLNWIVATDLKTKSYNITDIAYGNGKYVTVGRMGTTLGFIGCSTI